MKADKKVLYYQRFVQTTLRRVCSFNPIGSQNTSFKKNQIISQETDDYVAG